MTRAPALAACVALLAGCVDIRVNTSPGPIRAIADEMSVSGISSGGYAAGLLHVAHSERIDGVGIVAGGPWNCAQGNLMRALGPCISGQGLEIAPLLDAARAAADQGRIDPLEGVRGDRVWLFHGSKDTTVGAEVVQSALGFYTELGAGGSFVGGEPAAHGFPTLDTGVACGEFLEPYLQACGFDGAGEILQATAGDLDGKAREPRGELLTLDQSDFVDAGLAATGYAYVPAICRERACRVHVSFHGCKQGAEFIGSAFVEGAGYNRWADSNDLIIVYPQVAASAVNPLGCWDWWGYTGPDYATRDGKQIAAVMALVDRLAEAP